MSAFKVSELLNPAPSSPQRPLQPPKEPLSPSHLARSPPQSAAASSWSRGSSYATGAAVASTCDTSDNPHTLAASGQSSISPTFPPATTSYTASREPYSPVDGYGHTRRTSTFGSVAGPIEPSPTDLPQPPHSPTTLDRYHHGSKSPEDQIRRQSIFSSSAEAPRLAPIQSLTSALGEQINHKPPRENAYSHDTSSSYIQPAAQQDSVCGDKAAPNAVAESRECDAARDTPASVQTREPSPLKTEVKMSSEPKQESPSAQIKSEEPPASAVPISTPTRTSPNGTQGTPPQEDMDLETRKLVDKLKNEHGVRGTRVKLSIENIPAFEPPQPLTKKRPPPKPPAAVTKKGTAKKPPPKKKRVEAADASSPASVATRGSPTPSRKKGSKANTPALGSSPTAEDHVLGDDDDDASVASGDDVYCICRKGDDHSWMIACDGGCEDWFHGKCVKIREEDGDLIDRYICPNCEKKSGTVTTWKPMCRRDGCRKPARVTKTNTSKYCSEYCGELFMSRKVEESNTQAGGLDAQKKKTAKRKSVYADSVSNAGDESDDDDMGPRGGPLRPGEIKALATSITDVDSFRSLGDGVLSPPPTVSPSAEKFPNGELHNTDNEKLPLSYTLQPAENARITSIAEEKDELRKRRQVLRDKEKFVAMTREQVTRYADREGIKPKDVCGYDRRLGWDELQFERWRHSAAGKAVFRLGTLDTTENEDGDADADADGAPQKQVNGDVEMPDADDEKSKDSEFFCAKKRCQRHQGWQKLALHDVRNAESELANEMRKLDKEEREIRERAMLRWRKELGAKGVDGSVDVVG